MDDDTGCDAHRIHSSDVSIEILHEASHSVDIATVDGTRQRRGTQLRVAFILRVNDKPLQHGVHRIHDNVNQSGGVGMIDISDDATSSVANADM
jgi:hypothetical protein